MTDSPKIINIKQLAAMLNTPVPTVRYWLRHGRCPIPHIDGMKPPKWRVADVNAFLAGNSAGED